MGIPRIALAATASLTLLLAACGGVGDKLIVAPNPPEGGQAEAVSLWAVSPGEELSDSNIVATDAVDALQIFRRNPEGQVSENRLADTWKDNLLIGSLTGTGAFLTAGSPGERPSLIASAQTQFETLIGDRGVFTFTESGCQLATDVDTSEVIGEGRCRVRSDGNLVISWPADGGDLTIFDLRADKPIVVEGNFVNAQSITKNNGVVGIELDSDTNQMVAQVIDGETGEILGSGEPAESVGVMPVGSSSEAFVTVSTLGDQQTLNWMETDGQAETVATLTGGLLIPVSQADGVHFLSTNTEDPSSSSLNYWAPGEAATELISGNLIALNAAPGEVVVALRNEGRMEFFITEHADHIDAEEPLFEIELGEFVEPTISRALIQDHTMHLLVGTEIASYVRLDLQGTTSAQPLEEIPLLDLASIDTDGSTILRGQRTDGAAELFIAPAHSDEATLRATADVIGAALLREGKIYMAAMADDDVAIWSMRAQGQSEPEVLYGDVQLVSASFPTLGGAAEITAFDPDTINRQANP